MTSKPYEDYFSFSDLITQVQPKDRASAKTYEV